MKTTLALSLLSGLLLAPAHADRAAELFQQNCATCHGMDGKGDTAVGQSLKARNLITDSYRNGKDQASIERTLEQGLPGTGMVSFAYLPESDRKLLAAYVSKLNGTATTAVAAVETPKPAPVVEATPAPAPVAKLAPVAKPAPVAKAAPAPVAVKKPLVAAVAKPAAPAPAVAAADHSKAKALYQAQCASCHGMDGKAQTPTGMALKARNLVEDEYKQGSGAKEIALTLEKGVPGTGMASFAHIPADERMALANYLVAMRSGGPEAAPTAAPAAATVAAGGEDPLITKGRKLYKQNGCASCHGEKGQADNPTGMALGARSFVEGNYVYGGDIAGISKVLQNGIEGKAMAAYPGLSADDRTALATFLLALKGNPDIAIDPAPVEASGSGEVSISFAMEQLARTQPYPSSQKIDLSSKGAAIYAENCSSCHGDKGQGGLGVRMVSSAPYYRVETGPILGVDGDWMDRDRFDELILKGLPGRMMPGLGTMTKGQLDDLYQFFKANFD